ncbi:hypothetical protein ACOMHN_031996 [Nucella lapillus]
MYWWCKIAWDVPALVGLLSKRHVLFNEKRLILAWLGEQGKSWERDWGGTAGRAGLVGGLAVGRRFTLSAGRAGLVGGLAVGRRFTLSAGRADLVGGLAVGRRFTLSAGRAGLVGGFWLWAEDSLCDRLLDIPCKVCGDRSSGKHYGIYSCDGCSGFFKRSIHKSRVYTCKAQGELKGRCPIDKTHRNQCRACRLARCFQADMNKDAVQHERGPRKPKMKVAGDGSETSGTPSAFQAPLGPVVPVQPDLFQEVMARLLFTLVTWVRHVPCFLVLPPSDQTALLGGCWKDLFLLGLVQWGLSLEASARMIDTCRSLSRDEREKLTDILTRMRELNLDPTEFTCLKAVLLFGPEVGSLVDRKQVEAYEEQAQMMLTEHVQLVHPRQVVRVGRLLMLPAKLHAVPSTVVERTFFRGLVGAASIPKLIGNILHSDIV